MSSHEGKQRRSGRNHASSRPNNAASGQNQVAGGGEEGNESDSSDETHNHDAEWNGKARPGKFTDCVWNMPNTKKTFKGVGGKLINKKTGEGKKEGDSSSGDEESTSSSGDEESTSGSDSERSEYVDATPWSDGGSVNSSDITGSEDESESEEESEEEPEKKKADNDNDIDEDSDSEIDEEEEITPEKIKEDEQKLATARQQMTEAIEIIEQFLEVLNQLSMHYDRYKSATSFMLRTAAKNEFYAVDENGYKINDELSKTVLCLFEPPPEKKNNSMDVDETEVPNSVDVDKAEVPNSADVDKIEVPTGPKVPPRTKILYERRYYMSSHDIKTFDERANVYNYLCDILRFLDMSFKKAKESKDQAKKLNFVDENWNQMYTDFRNQQENHRYTNLLKTDATEIGIQEEFNEAINQFREDKQKMLYQSKKNRQDEYRDDRREQRTSRSNTHPRPLEASENQKRTRREKDEERDDRSWSLKKEKRAINNNESDQIMTQYKRGRHEATEDNVKPEPLPFIPAASYTQWRLEQHGNLMHEWTQSMKTDMALQYEYKGFDEYTWKTFKQMTQHIDGDSEEDNKPEDQSGDESGYESNEADVEPGPSPAKTKRPQNKVLKPAKPNHNSTKHNVSKTVKDQANPNLNPKKARTPHPQNKSGGAGYPQATQPHPFDSDMTPRPREGTQIPATPRPSTQIPTTPSQAVPIPATPKLPYEESVVNPQNKPLNRKELPGVGHEEKSLEWFTLKKKKNEEKLKKTRSDLALDTNSLQEYTAATVMITQIRQILRNLRARFSIEFPEQPNMFDN